MRSRDIIVLLAVARWPANVLLYFQSLPVCLNVCLGSAGDNVLLDEARIHAKLTDFGSAEDIQVRQCAHTGQAGELLSDNTISAVEVSQEIEGSQID